MQRRKEHLQVFDEADVDRRLPLLVVDEGTGQLLCIALQDLGRFVLAEGVAHIGQLVQQAADAVVVIGCEV